MRRGRQGLWRQPQQYRNGDIVTQVLDRTKGKGVDNAIVAGGENTFAEARIRMKNKPRDLIKPVVII